MIQRLKIVCLQTEAEKNITLLFWGITFYRLAVGGLIITLLQFLRTSDRDFLQKLFQFSNLTCYTVKPLCTRNLIDSSFFRKVYVCTINNLILSFTEKILSNPLGFVFCSSSDTLANAKIKNYATGCQPIGNTGNPKVLKNLYDSWMLKNRQRMIEYLTTP